LLTTTPQPAEHLAFDIPNPRNRRMIAIQRLRMLPLVSGGR
jgi:hypothetical protein